MKARIATGLGVLALAAVALAFRLPRLDQRPMHTDEAVQAIKSGILLETWSYTYDPNEFHGPLLHYLALPFMWLTAGRDFAATNETTFRLVPALLGAGLALLHLLLRPGLGRLAAWGAALLCALSPALVFYSRYYIPETLLVFFTLCTILAGWRYAQTGRAAWAIATGLCAGLMYAAKETCVFAFAAMAAALVATLAWQWRTAEVRPNSRSTAVRAASGQLSVPSPQSPAPSPLIAAAAVALIVAFVLFSGFFTNMAGPLDSLRTYTIWGRRGAGGGLHDHRWYYYLQLLLYVRHPYGPVWSEALIVALALVGFAAAVSGKGLARAHLPLARFFSVYTLLMTAGYAAIPYKTPWCMLGFLQGMCVLAGIGLAALLKAGGRRLEAGGTATAQTTDSSQASGLDPQASTPKPQPSTLNPRTSTLGPQPSSKRRWWLVRLPVAVLALAGAAHLGWQAFRASFEFASDRRNPYVYAHPTRDVVRLGQVVRDVAAVAPEGRDMLVRVITSDYWPLPWYFRGLRRVGYWDEPPAEVEAPVVITSPELAPTIERRLSRPCKQLSYGLRPTVVLMVYIREDLWAAYLQRRARGATGSP